MATLPAHFVAIDRYLEIERESEFRCEYIDGQVYPVSASTHNHTRIVRNALVRLSEQLRNQPCEPVSSDLKTFIAAYRVFTYPDVVVTCGPAAYYDARRDTITDATLIIEVLSPSTKDYDRGQKFQYYRSLPSFSEYVLISQEEIRAEHYVRQSDKSWVLRDFVSPSDDLELGSIGCRLLLDSLYERVEFAGSEESRTG